MKLKRRLSVQIVAVLSVLLIAGIGLDKLFPLNLARFKDRSPIVLGSQNTLLSVLLAKDERYRLPVQLSEVDPHFIEFLIAYEDKRFFSHLGVDPLALGRAAWQWIQAGKVVSGGSTLSLQTVRLLEPRSRTFTSKLKEVFRALQLEYHFSKREILEIYLTLAPYGGNIEGIRAASLAYFAKEPKQLTPAEAALLVALPQQPTRLRPDVFPARARYHRDKVLSRMEKVGVLSQQQSLEAKEDKLPVAKVPFPNLALHLAHRLMFESPKDNIHRTPLDAGLQQQVETLLKRQVQLLEPTHSIAVLVVDNKTRNIMVYVGSADFFEDKRCGQVDMIPAIRSPGSTLKPFIYALGFEEQLIHPQTIIQDIPTHFSGYAPSNFKDIFHGAVTIREALQQSLNVPAVAILEKIGAGRFAAHLRALGVTLKLQNAMTNPSLPIALGGVGTRLSDLVALYSGLANDGQYLPLNYRVAQAGPSEKMVTSEAAQMVKAILEDAPLPDGFVDWYATHQAPVAYKTGTSYGFRDALAIGFTEDYTVGVWVGRADGTPLPSYTGRTHATPILFKVFSLLPERTLNRKGSKVFRTHISDRPLPPALSHFKKGYDSKISEDEFQIVFPKDGTTVSLEVEEKGTENDWHTIPISLVGGKAPFYCLENGRPLDKSFHKHEILWKPKRAGFWEITVLDSEGHSATTVIQLKAQ